MISNFKFGRFNLDLSKPRIMGIVNVTPDSFSDGGHHNEATAAIEHALKLIDDGAEILDLGAESTRPGSDAVPADEELRRLVPVIKGLTDAGVPLSVDTFKPEVMQACLDLGVDLINDIYALRQPGAVNVLAKYPEAAICIMHMHGEPKTMQESPPDYEGDITQAVKAFLQDRVDTLNSSGIDSSRIMIDPGFGFGKTVDQNYELLHNLSSLTDLKLPILAGVSRKSMLGAITGSQVDNRVPETLAANLAAADRSATVLRVHDVQVLRQALQVWEAINSNRSS